MWWFECHGFVSAPKWRMSPGFHGWYQSVSDERDRGCRSGPIERDVGLLRSASAPEIASSPEPPWRKSPSQPPKIDVVLVVGVEERLVGAERVRRLVEVA